jgi:hypothetical protein
MNFPPRSEINKSLWHIFPLTCLRIEVDIENVMSLSMRILIEYFSSIKLRQQFACKLIFPLMYGEVGRKKGDLMVFKSSKSSPENLRKQTFMVTKCRMKKKSVKSSIDFYLIKKKCSWNFFVDCRVDCVETFTVPRHLFFTRKCLKMEKFHRRKIKIQRYEWLCEDLRFIKM